MFKFKRTRRAAGKTYRYVRDDLLNLEEAQGHFEDIKALARHHMDPRSRSSRRSETFAHAVERMGLTPEDIAASYRLYSFRFNLFSFFLGVALAMGCWGAIQGNWLLVLGSIGPLMVFLAMMFNASFRCFQIRHHELLPLSAWWHHRAEWLPGEYSPPPTMQSMGGKDGKIVSLSNRRQGRER